MATNVFPCGTTIYIRTHMVGGWEIYKEKRDELGKGMRKSDDSM